MRRRAGSGAVAESSPSSPTGSSPAPSVAEVDTRASPDPRRGLGALGERLAAEHLERAGYAVVTRNWRSRLGELDIVAADSRTLVFCEVKTRVAGGRRGPVEAVGAIGPAKRRRLRLLAREWLAEDPAGRPWRDALRFDAVGVTLDRAGALLALEHIEDAF